MIDIKFINENEIDYKNIPENHSGKSILEQAVGYYFYKKGYDINFIYKQKYPFPKVLATTDIKGSPDLVVWNNKEFFFVEVKKVSYSKLKKSPNYIASTISFLLSQLKWFKKYENFKILIVVVESEWLRK